MSFETARAVNLDSFASSYSFRRPQPRLAGNEMRQTVNISNATLERSARTKLKCVLSARLAYGEDGRLANPKIVGQRLDVLA